MNEKKGYKKTEIGIIPNEWDVAKLDKYVEIKGRIGWRGLKASEYTKKGPYLIANKHLFNGRVNWDCCDHLSSYRYDESQEIQLKKDDIIMSKDGTIGQVAIIDYLPDKTTINSTMMLIRIKNREIIPKFLYYFFQGPLFKKFLYQKISGGQIPHIFQRDMKNLNFIILPFPEQKKIAEILSTVDEAIAKVDEAVEKTERLKKGLMQELLTKGIGHKKFEDKGLGMMPKEWKVKKITDLFTVETGTTPSTKKKEYWEDGNVNWITPADMSKLKSTIFIKDSTRKITEKGLRDTNLTLLSSGSIIISTRAPVGYVAALKAEATFNQGCKGLIPKNAEKISTEFYTYYLLSKKAILNNSSSGSTFKELPKKILENFSIPLPNIKEQKKIAEIINTIDQRLQSLTEKKERLEKIKKGLMNDLLTGKRRVKL